MTGAHEPGIAAKRVHTSLASNKYDRTPIMLAGDGNNDLFHTEFARAKGNSI